MKEAPIFEEIHAKCAGCNKVHEDGKHCIAYIKPAIFWRYDKVCPLANHIKLDEKKPQEKVRVGQQKQKKK